MAFWGGTKKKQEKFLKAADVFDERMEGLRNAVINCGINEHSTASEILDPVAKNQQHYAAMVEATKDLQTTAVAYAKTQPANVVQVIQTNVHEAVNNAAKMEEIYNQWVAQCLKMANSKAVQEATMGLIANMDNFQLALSKLQELGGALGTETILTIDQSVASIEADLQQLDTHIQTRLSGEPDAPIFINVLNELKQRWEGHKADYKNLVDNPSAAHGAAGSLTATYTPFVKLAMGMAYADGVLSSEEVKELRKQIQEGFQLPKDEMSELKAIMKEEVPENIDGLVATALSALPDQEKSRDILLGLLVTIAKADGVVDPDEVSFLRRVAKIAGMSDAQFEDYAKQQHIETRDPWVVLGVSRSATLAEVKKAYKKAMSQYHPDKVINLPEEFQQLAHQKCVEFSACMEAIEKKLKA